MKKILNFDKARIKKIVQENFNSADVRYEILISVKRFIYSYIEAEYKYPTQDIKIEDQTVLHFDADEERFVLALQDIFDYWGLEHFPEFQTKQGKLFETFPTVESIAVYVLEKLSQN